MHREPDRTTAVALLLLAGLASAARGQAVFFTNAGISKTDPDGSCVRHLFVQSGNGAHDIAIDPLARKIYYTWFMPPSIRRADLDGTNIQTLVSRPGHFPDAIDLDLGAGRIYWTSDSLRRSSLDGSDMEVLVPIEGDAALDVALDLEHGRVYWTEWFLDEEFGRIRSADLDGENVEDIIVVPGGLPLGIAIDAVAARMYWSDFAYGSLHRANLDGTDPQVVISGIAYPRDLALDAVNKKLFWATEVDPAGIFHVNLDGSSITPLNTGNASSLAIDLGSPAPLCSGDVNGDGAVNVVDLVEIVLDWGPCGEEPDPCHGDMNNDYEVALEELLQVILNWS